MAGLSDVGQEKAAPLLDESEAATALARALRRSRAAVALTGAGISTECGVPDFRSPASPWLRHPPIAYRDFLASLEARREAWRRKFAMDALWRAAQPGRGHEALRVLHASGRLAGVITQNIDNLHQLSGLPDEAVIELHGNGTYAACLSCRRRHDLDVIRRAFEASGEPPECEECAGPVKSATVSFGEPIPEPAMRRALGLVVACDLFLAIGSSLRVNPAARLPLLAHGRGAALVVINREPTPLDAHARLVIRGDIGSVLAKTVHNLQEPG